MFLIECKTDNSLTIVEDEHVVYDKDTEVEEDELVTFFVGGKSFLGYVRARGDNEESLKAKQKQLLKDYKKTQSKSNKTSEQVIISPIKTRRNLRKESPLKVNKKKENVKKTKKKDEKVSSTKSRVESQKEVAHIINKSKNQVVSSSESSDEAEKSPSKDELKAKLKRLRAAHRDSNPSTSTDNAQLHLHGDVQTGVSSEEEKDIEREEGTSAKKKKVEMKKVEIKKVEIKKVIDEKTAPSQLFGKDYLKPMTQLGNSEIYCISDIYEYALSGKQVTHIARRLIDGVFTKEAIASSTFTGQPPRAQGRERQIIPVSPLNDTAKNAIIDFAIQRGQSRQFEIPTRSFIIGQMSQRVGEIKRQISISKALFAPPRLPEP